MQTVNIYEAKTQLSRLIEQAVKGDYVLHGLQNRAETKRASEDARFVQSFIMLNELPTLG